MTLAVNPYHRRGFGARWLTIGLSAIVPADVHWFITAELTYHHVARGRAVSHLSRWVMARVAHQIGFTTMPAMPPRAGEEAERARAVGRVLSCVWDTFCPAVRLAPEGADSSDRSRRRPPAGAGRFLVHLAAAGLTITPVGAHEAGRSMCFHFGLADDGASGPEARGCWAAGRVLRANSTLLSSHLRGDYAGPD